MVQRTEGKGEVGCIKIGKNALEGRSRQDIQNYVIIVILDPKCDYVNSRNL